MKRLIFCSLSILLMSSAIAQSQPGDIDKNVVLLDVDVLNPFYCGRAIVKKGDAEALINARGVFVIPFHTYKFIWRFEGGHCNVYNLALKKHQLIDTNGKVVQTHVPINAMYSLGMSDPAFRLEDDGYTSFNPMTDITTKWKKGQKVSYKNQEYDGRWSEGLTFYRKGLKYGFANEQLQVTIPPQFDKAELFSEGMAAVAKYNEFGELKWGFINKSGKIVIPLQFTFKPGNFKSGLALINPKDKTEFNFCYIDKNGDIKIKIKHYKKWLVRTPETSEYEGVKGDINSGDGEFENGYAIWRVGADKLFLDTLGNFHTDAELAKQCGFENIPEQFWLGNEIKNHQIFMYYNSGMLNLKKKTHLPPYFRDLSYTDPVSKLTYAKFTKDKNSKMIEGYLNEDGIFVIIKAEPSKW